MGLLTRIYEWKVQVDHAMNDIRIMWPMSCGTSLCLAVFFVQCTRTDTKQVIYISVPRFMWMTISYYMSNSNYSVIERIMTGIETKDYIKHYMANQPQNSEKEKYNFYFDLMSSCVLISIGPNKLLVIIMGFVG